MEETYNINYNGELANIIKKELEKNKKRKIKIEALSFSSRYQELTVNYSESEKAGGEEN